MSMIKLSTGVELSESTVISALKKAGISVEPKRYQFKAGDVAKGTCGIRIIIETNGELKSFDDKGNYMSTGQEAFENNSYKYVGRLSDMLS